MSKPFRRVRHSPSVPKDREMVAPYNFIPLPDELFIPDGDPPPATEFVSGTGEETFSGVIDYEAEALSPLYTRAAVPVTSLAPAEAAMDFFHHGDPARPVLPGSSIRGMVRSLVTLLSFGKLPRSKKGRRLFFRSFARDVLAREYVGRMTEKNRSVDGPKGRAMGFRSRTLAGFLTCSSSGDWSIRPCYQLRVSYKILPSGLHIPHRGEKSMKVLSSKHLYKRVWIRAEGLEPHWRHHPARQQHGRHGSQKGMYTWRRDVDAIRFDDPRGERGWVPGWLVLTGPMQKKGAEFVFVENQNEPVLPVAPDIIREVDDLQDQITQFQELSFPGKGQLARGVPELKERKSGMPGMPVWYLYEGGKVQALGRAQNFRLRYEKSTEEFVPPGFSVEGREDLDLAERIFGRVREGDDSKHAQVRGRVRFEDAFWSPSEDSPFLPPLSGASKGDRVPHILSSPKPTAFQNYLSQDGTGELELSHFSSETEIRGFKLYWHRNKAQGEGRTALTDEQLFQTRATPRGTQETVIRPVKSGTKFRGKVRFDNLTLLELGALLAAIDLPDGMAHRFGMGKPLGMGSLRVQVPRIRFIDREARYSSWTSTGSKDEAFCEEKAAAAREEFRKAMVHHNNERTDSPNVPEDTALWDVPRISLMGMMLSWDKAPPASKTRYIGLEDREESRYWRYRRVLPGPHQVQGLKDPLGTALQSRERFVHQAAPRPATEGSEDAPSSERGASKLQVGEEYEATLLEPVKGHHWKARVGDEELMVHRVPGKKKGGRPGKTIVVAIGISGAERVGFFRGMKKDASAAANPDDLPDDALHTAKIVGGGAGSWRAKLEGGTREWTIRGAPPPGVEPEKGATVKVRIVKSGEEYLNFATS